MIDNELKPNSRSKKRSSRSLFSVQMPPVNIKWKGFYTETAENGKKNLVTIDHMIFDINGGITGKGTEKGSGYKIQGFCMKESSKVVIYKIFQDFKIHFLGNWSSNGIKGSWTIDQKIGGDFRIEPDWDQLNALNLKGWEVNEDGREEKELIVIGFKEKKSQYENSFVHKTEKIYSIGGDSVFGGYTINGRIDYQSMTLEFTKFFHIGREKHYFGKLKMEKDQGSWSVSGTWVLDKRTKGSFWYVCDDNDWKVESMVFKTIFLNGCFFDQNFDYTSRNVHEDMVEEEDQ